MDENAPPGTSTEELTPGDQLALRRMFYRRRKAMFRYLHQLNEEESHGRD